MIGSSKKQDVKIPADTNPMVFANNLNNFFNKFDINQSNDDLTALKYALVTNVNEINELEISTSSVEKVFRQIKAAGPDLLSGKIFKLCYGELAPDLFLEWMNTGFGFSGFSSAECALASD